MDQLCLFLRKQTISHHHHSPPRRGALAADAACMCSYSVLTSVSLSLCLSLCARDPHVQRERSRLVKQPPAVASQTCTRKHTLAHNRPGEDGMAVRGGLVQSCPRMLTFLLLSAYFFFAVSCTSCPEEWPSSYWQGKRDFSDSNFTVFTMHDEAWLPNGWGNGFTWSSIPEDKTVPGTKMERRQWGLVDAIIGGQAGWQTPIPTGTIVKIFGFIKVR